MERRSVAAIAALADDLRRSLYAFIRRAGRPVTREEVAESAGISRKLAAFHLDKMVHVGLLEAHQRSPALRRGPGRSPKVYEPASGELRVSIPERRYDLVGEILADAVAGSEDARTAASRLAFQRGLTLGADAARRCDASDPPATVRTVLDDLGYEPADEDDRLCLRNCPYRELATRNRELVCGINRDFIDGLLRGFGDDTTRAVLAPTALRCCVELHRR